jgi:hypothetical protein
MKLLLLLLISLDLFILSSHSGFFIPLLIWILNDFSQSQFVQEYHLVSSLDLSSALLLLVSNKDLAEGKTYSTNLDMFYQWFVGFSDAESCFSIVPKKDTKGIINRFTFMFSIGLHIDDIDVLNTIQKLLGVGIVSKSNNECKFTVNDIEGIKKLIAIFDKYNLNTTKYLDYSDFKEAFNLYQDRGGVATEELKQNILNLKNRMNTNRVSFDLPSHHEIKITSYWLLGAPLSPFSYFINKI